MSIVWETSEIMIWNLLGPVFPNQNFGKSGIFGTRNQNTIFFNSFPSRTQKNCQGDKSKIPQILSKLKNTKLVKNMVALSSTAVSPSLWPHPPISPLLTPPQIELLQFSHEYGIRSRGGGSSFFIFCPWRQRIFSKQNFTFVENWYLQRHFQGCLKAILRVFLTLHYSSVFIAFLIYLGFWRNVQDIMLFVVFGEQ